MSNLHKHSIELEAKRLREMKSQNDMKRQRKKEEMERKKLEKERNSVEEMLKKIKGNE